MGRKLNIRYPIVFGIAILSHVVILCSPGRWTTYRGLDVPRGEAVKSFTLINITEAPEPEPPPRALERPPSQPFPLPHQKEPQAENLIPVEEPRAEVADAAVIETGEENSRVEADLASNGIGEEAAEVATRQDGAVKNYLNAYTAGIRNLIDKRKKYPNEARQRRQEGGVCVRFTLRRDGTLAGEPELENPSRYSRLNTAAINAVRTAVPFPPFPQEISAETMPFLITINFSMR